MAGFDADQIYRGLCRTHGTAVVEVEFVMPRVGGVPDLHGLDRRLITGRRGRTGR